MTANPYQKSTEFLTAKLPKLTRDQALQQIRKPAIGLIAVSGTALAIAFGTMLYSAVHFGLKLLSDDETTQVQSERLPGESKQQREERELREKKLAAEANFVSLATVFIAAMTLVLVNAVVLSGAIQMRQLKKHRSSVAAAAVAVIPLLSPLFVVGIPFGIWAMVKLGNPEIKRYFTN